MHRPLPDDMTQARWLVGANADTAEIPAYSLVKVTSTDVQGRFDVAEPDAADNVIYVVGDLPIPAADDDGDGIGAITGDWPAWAAYDADDGTPAIGETWGHEAGTFLLKKDKPGFRIVSDPDEEQEIVRVERVSAGGSLIWGANDGTANVPFPTAESPPSPYYGPAFDEASSTSVLTALPDTLITIPDDVDDVVIYGNLRLGVAITGLDVFPNGYAYFYVPAYIVLLDEEDDEPITYAGPYGTYPFSATGSGTPSHDVVSGQRLTTGGATTASFGHYTTEGGGHWYGDMPAFGRVDAAAIRTALSITTVRLAWAVGAPVVSGFPATWDVTYYQTARPLTYLVWEIRPEPTP